MSFYLKVLFPEGALSGALRGEIALGDHVETFPLLTTRWSVDDYLRQWLRSAEAIADGEVQRCMFVTDIQPIQDSTGLSYWALFRAQDGLVAQERFMRVVPDVDLFSPQETEVVIPPRIQGSPEKHSLVSEWQIAPEEVVEFVRSAGIRGGDGGAHGGAGVRS